MISSLLPSELEYLTPEQVPSLASAAGTGSTVQTDIPSKKSLNRIFCATCLMAFLQY